MHNDYLKNFIAQAIKEDIGDGDHTSLACIPENTVGKSKLLVKQDCILAGVDMAEMILKAFDPNITFDRILNDGTRVTYGDIAFYAEGKIRGLLTAERLLLNVMQRMSGIASQTNRYVTKLDGLKTRILDTRKTTPGFRYFEKEAVRIGGGTNHRFGLYDMIMIKDNHIDFSGGLQKAIDNTKAYLKAHNKDLKVIVEARSLDDVKTILEVGGTHRILLDNFNTDQTREAVDFIAGRIETESSGGITLDTIRSYAECGVDYISVGALTHQIFAADLSFKAV